MTSNPIQWTQQAEYESVVSERRGETEKMCYRTCQKGNQLPCSSPYVATVMFHDIHPDADTCQPEVLALFPCTSIWTTTTTGSWIKQDRKEEAKVGGKKQENMKRKLKNSLLW